MCPAVRWLAFAQVLRYSENDVRITRLIKKLVGIRSCVVCAFDVPHEENTMALERALCASRVSALAPTHIGILRN